MPSTLNALFSLCILTLVAGVSLRAAEPSDSGEARLRETLRSTLLELRTAQSDLAALQAAQAAQADERKALDEQIALLKKHAMDDRAAAEKTIADLKAKVAAQNDQIANLSQLAQEWKAAAEKVNRAAQTAEAERIKASASAARSQARAADIQAKNEELFRVANEILTRYEKFSLGEQFLAREPFIGRKRVELENLIQDYDDRILALRSDP